MLARLKSRVDAWRTEAAAPYRELEARATGLSLDVLRYRGGPFLQVRYTVSRDIGGPSVRDLYFEHVTELLDLIEWRDRARRSRLSHADPRRRRARRSHAPAGQS
jgi:hypothetical protein